VRLSILYLDDERGCLDVFYETFRQEHDVRTAASAAEARRMLAERPADIVISDQAMPDISGTHFLAEVAAVYPSSYRVLLTGSVHLLRVMPEVGGGLIQLFVPKPWTTEVMHRMLERAAAYFESEGGGR
jgi:DNA-binding NtrC family response regulator